MSGKQYIAIDLKSFYASVECVERGLDPLTANLVVADESRTEKTICLAVSPALKAYGIPGRPRLFEVNQRVAQINAKRRYQAPRRTLVGESYNDAELKKDPGLALSFIAAPPRMAYYMQYSARIYQIYLKYIAPEDIHVYSIDEVFIDATPYLKTYKMTARELTERMIRDVLDTTGITATAGIGTNLYLCKVAMDIVAKHMPADERGVRIAELDEMSYRRLLWDHRPITDFWRVGRGYAKKLERYEMYTMGDVARCSVGRPDEFRNEKLLYRLFGINAELLIDHAWGWEPCTIADIKAYKPENSSICSGQVLTRPYRHEETALIVREMADLLALDLVDKRLVTDQIILSVGYDAQSLADPEISQRYNGEVTTDRYGRQIPKHSNGSANLGKKTSSARLITEAAVSLFERISDKELLVRRLNLTANHVIDETQAESEQTFEQIDFFTDQEELRRKREEEAAAEKREKNMQRAILGVKKKYGKNAVIKGMDLQEGATTVSRNGQIGGHKK